MDIKILAIDDVAAHTEQLVDLLDGKEIAGHNIIVHTENDFEQGIQKLLEYNYDIVILDVYQGDPSEDNDNLQGKVVLEKIKETVPIAVILHTALPAHVQDLATDIVRVVSKDEGDIKAEVESLIQGGVPLIKKKLIEHVHKELTKYYWEFAEKHPELIKAAEDNHLFEHLITRRLALTLDDEGVSKIFGDGISQGMVHPLSMYVFPPIEGNYRMGDILKKADDNTFWVVMTPSCDLAHEGKTKHILLAPATRLKDRTEYINYQTTKSNGSKGELTKLIKSANDKYYFLPRIAMIDMPDLIVELQQLTSVLLEVFSGYDNIATLDDPYAQDLLSKFTRLYNRPGSPDIDDQHILGYLESEFEDNSDDSAQAAK
jgi:CheY-like chemotaxis protein